MDRKLKASTLLETLIAMIIIVVMMSLGSLIYLNILKSTDLEKQLLANSILQVIADDIKLKQSFFDDKKLVSGFTVSVECHLRKENNDMMNLKLSAFDMKGALVASYKELILVNSKAVVKE